MRSNAARTLTPTGYASGAQLVAVYVVPVDTGPVVNEPVFLTAATIVRSTVQPALQTLRITIPVTVGASNVETFQLLNPDGSELQLAESSVVTFSLPQERACITNGRTSISSEDADAPVTFNGNEIYAKFGALSPYPGGYYATMTVDGVVLAGMDYPTEIVLKVYR